MDRVQHVFIVTYGRSGSTLLQTVLNGIDGYCIRGENNNVLLPVYRAVQRLRRARQRHMAGVSPTSPWFGLDGADPDALARHMCDAVRQTVLHVPSGTRVAGFKEVRYDEIETADEFNCYLDFLADRFGGARFVFNMRAGAAVARSKRWRDDPVDVVLRRVADMDRRFAAYAARRPETSFLIRYEDYDGSPQGLKPLFDFLGEPFDMDSVGKILGVRLPH